MPALDPSHSTPDGSGRLIRLLWVLTVALLVGVPGVRLALNESGNTHTARGSLWVPDAPRPEQGAFAPARATGAPDGAAWISLLRSHRVLESVAVEHRLYLRAPEHHAPAFFTFDLADPFAPGTYELQVDPSGEGFVLATAEGARVQEGRVGEPIGRNVGFLWTPAPGSFEPGAVVRFSVVSPRDAARDLSSRLVAVVDPTANLLLLELTGSSSERTADVLNSLMERHVEVAGELKRGWLAETLAILEQQLDTMEAELARGQHESRLFRAAYRSETAGSKPPDPGQRASRAFEEARLARRVRSAQNLRDEIRGRVEDARRAVATMTPDVRVLDWASYGEEPRGAPRAWIAIAAILACVAPTLCALVLAHSRARSGGALRAPMFTADDMTPILAIVVGGLLALITTALLIG